MGLAFIFFFFLLSPAYGGLQPNHTALSETIPVYAVNDSSANGNYIETPEHMFFRDRLRIIYLATGRSPITRWINTHNFSMCMPSYLIYKESNSSTVGFNQDSAHHTTKLIKPPWSKQSLSTTIDIVYYVELKEVMVGQNKIAVPPNVWRFKNHPDERGGTRVEFSKTGTVLPKEAYNQLRDHFKSFIQANVPELVPVRNVPQEHGPCYKLINSTIDWNTLHLPQVLFRFTDGGEYVARQTDQVLFPYPPLSAPTLCLAFAPSWDESTIIGAILLQHTRVVFDFLGLTISFEYHSC